ncbi:hypothetical protein EON63_20400 [archaeon]|nr:MAG: hypothetical protein EON63_20400 [archaeon]
MRIYMHTSALRTLVCIPSTDCIYSVIHHHTHKQKTCLSIYMYMNVNVYIRLHTHTYTHVNHSALSY